MQVKETPEVVARRKAATLEAAERFHRVFHEVNGANAPCNVCTK